MRTALIALTFVVLAACSEKKQEAAPIPDAAATTTTAGSAPLYTAVVDWPDRTAEVPDIAGFRIAFCDGDAPLLCVNKGDDVQGVIEHVERAGEGKDLAQGARAWSAEFLASIAEDRQKGCDADYSLTPELTVEVTVAGRPGFRYGYSGSIRNRQVERVIGFGVVMGNDLHLIVMNALADNGCLFRESELSLDAAAKIEPILPAIAAGSSF